MNIDQKLLDQWYDAWLSTARDDFGKRPKLGHFIAQRAAAYGAQQERERLLAGSGEPVGEVKRKQNCGPDAFFIRWKKLMQPGETLYTADQLASARLQGEQDERAKLKQDVVGRILNTEIVDGESPEVLRDAICNRVIDVFKDTFVRPNAAITAAEGSSHE